MKIKIFTINKDLILGVIFSLTIGLTLLSSQSMHFHQSSEQAISDSQVTENKHVVIIDAGHGGTDPGKVAGKVLEKNINLQIATKLQEYLEKKGYEVIMTRTTDDELPSNKQSEMYKRKTIANSSEADIFISIHQNSSPNGGAKGAQVYYFQKSERSQTLAKYVDSAIKNNANPSKKFVAMPNKDYYVLRQTTMPAILIECGFLSNSGEKWKLTTKDYQNKMASAIYIGIENYFKSYDNL